MLVMSILDSSTVPLKPAELFVLAVLRTGPLHGYGIVQEVAARSAGRIQIRPGNLYRVLDRMLERGLVEVAGSRGEDDDRRTDYRITPRGRKTAQAEARLLSLVLADLLAT
jgi:DNA-binding PadR family transcriptional regulator